MDCTRYKHHILQARHDALGLNVAEECRKLGISRMTYYGTIGGTCRVSLEMLDRIAGLLGVGLSDVLILDRQHPVPSRPKMSKKIRQKA